MVNKTVQTENSVPDFLAEHPHRLADTTALCALMGAVSGEPAKLWGPAIVGFGSYHYRYDSGREGDAPILSFSPRKAAISLYVFTGLPEHEHLLEGLGKFKMGKACLYINKLADIDIEVLERLMKATIAYLQEKYPDR